VFEISQLRCFVAVAEELHFRRAAERLNMTQPPLSRQIRLLEHHVGTKLLERTSRNVRLTAAGKAFLPEAARILKLAEEAASTARQVARGARGSLAIGFTASFGYHLLPQIVCRMRESYPGVTLKLREMVTHSQLEALNAGQLDVGLLRPHASRGGLNTVHLKSEPLMLAIAEGEAGLWPDNPRLEHLHQKPFLMYTPHEAQYFFQLVSGFFERTGVRPEIVEYVDQIHTMMALVSSGLGCALIPATASRLYIGGIVMRRLLTEPADPVEMVVSYREDSDNPVLEAFMECILPDFVE